MNGQAVATVAAVNPVVRPHARPPAIKLHVLLRLAGQTQQYVFRPPAGAPHAVHALRLRVAVTLAVCTSAGAGDRRRHRHRRPCAGLTLVAKQSKVR